MKVLVLSAVFFSASAAFANGYSVGNGGVIWACAGASGVLDAGMLSDLYEAREQHRWTVIDDPGGDPFVLYERRKTWLKQALPDMFAALEKRFEYVETHRVFVNAELLPTLDYNNVIKPEASQCPRGSWRAVNIANFREEDQQVLIRSELWNSPNLPTLDKAALLFHEAVYYWMRTYYGSTNSDKSRRLTGLLFSRLEPEEMKREIVRLLGALPENPDGKFVCTMRNTRRNQVYVAYGETSSDTALTVRMRCQDDPEAQWCARGTLQCEAVTGPVRHRCVSENLRTHRLFTGRGRNLVEARFNAHMACYVGSQGQAQSCPDEEFMECE